MSSPEYRSFILQLVIVALLSIAVGAVVFWSVWSSIQAGQFALGKGASRVILTASSDPVIFWGLNALFCLWLLYFSICQYISTVTGFVRALTSFAISKMRCVSTRCAKPDRGYLYVYGLLPQINGSDSNQIVKFGSVHSSIHPVGWLFGLYHDAVRAGLAYRSNDLDGQLFNFVRND